MIEVLECSIRLGNALKRAGISELQFATIPAPDLFAKLRATKGVGVRTMEEAETLKADREHMIEVVKHKEELRAEEEQSAIRQELYATQSPAERCHAIREKVSTGLNDFEMHVFKQMCRDYIDQCNDRIKTAERNKRRSEKRKAASRAIKPQAPAGGQRNRIR